jgi:ABC-type branched-subunit amino acid transport system substrate-binding protein
MRGCAVAVALVAPWLLGAGGLTPEQERGRRIYVECASPAGREIVAVLGAGVEVEASAVPCANCHGRDGKGRPEGGVTPTDITWASLTKPYGVNGSSGRRHPPYDQKLLKRAIAMGIDPAGNELHVAMPRYRMTAQDMADLVAYLTKLGTEADPGVGVDVLRIGLLPPRPGPLDGMGRAVRAAVAARLAAVNAEGGLYGRRLELVTLELAGPPAARRTDLAAALRQNDVFAVIAAFLAGGDDDLADVFQEERVPLLGPFTLHPREELPLNRYVFYLLPGIETEARALVSFARRNPGAAPARPAVLAPRGEELDVAVADLEKACEGWAPLTVMRYGRDSYAPAALAAELSGQKADPVLFLGAGSEAAALLRAADALAWRPRFLVTATAAGAELFSAPSGFSGRIYASLPALPEPEPQAGARYRALSAAGALPAEHLSAQLTALAAAEVLIEGLKRTGRDVRRESLVEALEGMNRFSTGYGPAVSYGAGRRLGAKGAYVLAVDLVEHRFAPGGEWIDVK